MRLRRNDILHRKIAALSNLLEEKLRHDAKGDAFERLVHQLDLLESLARRRGRRRSLAWAVGAAAIALAGVIALRFMPLAGADVSLTGDTRAFTLTNGTDSQNILPTGLQLNALALPSAKLARCTDSRQLQPSACDGAASLQLNALWLNSQAVAVVRKAGTCFELEVLAGGASLLLSTRSQPARDAPVDIRSWAPDNLTMGPTDVVKLCPAQEAALECVGLASLMLGDRREVSSAEAEDKPTLSKARLSILDTSQSIDFRRTDVPRFEHLAGGVMIARIRDSIELSLAGRASRIAVETGPHSQDLMPNCLDWVRNSPPLKASLAVLSAVLGALLALRERWLGELV